MPSGPGKYFTMAELGYDDPTLLSQLNSNIRLYNPTFGGDPSLDAGGGVGQLSTNDRTKLGTLANAGCAAIRAQWGDVAGRLCEAGVDVFAGNDTRGASYADKGTTLAPPCPNGGTPNADGSCDDVGVIAAGERLIPGGRTGMSWTATLGMYGAGITAATVSRQTRVCPRAHVLGNDGVCYRRGSQGASRTFRAWDPGHKPLLTGGDVNALNKAKRLQKTISRMATKHGKKVCHTCTTGRKKK